MSMKNNLFLLIGEDKKSIDFSLFNILKKIDYDDNNKIIYDMNENTFADVLEEVSMVSMFSSVKVIIVNNFIIDDLSDNELEYLDKFVKSKNNDVYLILITDKVDTRKKNYRLFKDEFMISDISKFDSNNIYNFVRDKIKENGYKIDNMNIEYLLSKIGNDINNINNELDKLFIYKIDNKNISREDIDLLVFDNIDNVMYEFTNAILDNDINKIKIMYDKFMIDNVGIDYLISSIAGSFRTSLIIKLLYNKNMSNLDIAKVIGKKEFFVKKSLERLYYYSVNDLKSYINKLALIDRNFKSGKDNIGSFELFLFFKES